MQKLAIEDFKAFHEPIEIELKNEQQNVLLYGENGSGKSSIFEAIKLLFFRDRLDREATAPASDQIEETQFRNHWINSYLNQAALGNFSVSLNGIDYSSFDSSSDYEVFMISHADVRVEDSLSLIETLNSIYFKPCDTNAFVQEHKDLIVEYVNERLQSEFLESIRIRLDGGPDCKIEVRDPNRNDLKSVGELHVYFNEAKLTLVKLLLLFSCIELLGGAQNEITTPRKKRVLVLDDIVSSLDIANRTLFVRYVMRHFAKEQKIIMTHNVAFYNFIQYYVNEELHEAEKWMNCGLYEINSVHKLHLRTTDSVAQIRVDYLNNPCDPAIGNRIRQYFEVLLFELTKILQVGPFFESQKLINDLKSEKKVYLMPASGQDTLTVYDLIEKIQQKVQYAPAETLKTTLTDLFQKYDADNYYPQMLDIVDQLKVYQKVSLHQSSHGHRGMVTDSNKEKLASLYLLEEMERVVKACGDKNTYSL